MKKNKFLAWLLIVAVFITTFSTSVVPAHANGANNDPVVVTTEFDQSVVEQSNVVVQEPDTESPTISIEGIQNNQQFSSRDVGFKVVVTDNVYKDIVPSVKVNSVTLNATNGEYKASLNPGSNTITVTAVDGAKNKAVDVTYQVIYNITAKDQLDRSLAYILKSVKNPQFATDYGDWSVLSLARANYTVPSSYYNLYYNNLTNSVKQLISEDGKLDATKSTENSRAILGLASIGKDITNVAGYDLRKAFADFDFVKKQGINGPIFALIAIDTRNYDIPVVEGVKDQTTREKLIQHILSQEITGGGWGFGSWQDVDITGMAIQGLAPYYATHDNVKAAVDRAIQWLASNSKIQAGSLNTESMSQVIVALTAVGIDPHSDSKFINKNGKSLIDVLLANAGPNGGFKSLPASYYQVNSMATDQGTYALVAYDRLINNKYRLYDMRDVQLEQPNNVVAKQQLNKSLAYILNTVKNPSFGTGSGEWSILSLARANYEVPSGYYDLYYNNVAERVKGLMKDGKLDASRSTENSRAILGLTSIGKDITDVAGYNLINALADYQYVQKQGNNGPIFALIALDSHNYEIPKLFPEPDEKGVIYQSTRANLVQYILDKEVKKGTADAGGWALGVTKADFDMTGMAIQALAPYYTREDVKDAVDRAITWLSTNQNIQGGFTGMFGTSSESIAQVIVALTSVGINPQTDPKFIKNGKSLIDALLAYAGPNGGFKSSLNGSVNGMSTDQATYALVAYDRLINHKNRLFDMNDVVIEQPTVEPTAQPTVEPSAQPTVQPETPKEVEVQLPSGDKPVVAIPDDAHDYIIPISSGDSSKEITVTIPEANQSKVSVNLPSNSELPQIEATKGDVTVVIPMGAKVRGGDASAIELISPLTGTESVLKDTLNPIIPADKKLENIIQAFSMGGSARVEFNKFITLTFKDLKGKDAAYIQDGTPHAIQKFASDALGFESGKSEYAYDSGNDLIVKTNHFTDYIAYTSIMVQPPVGDGGSVGGGETTPSKQYVTLSVDKLTINKGYVVPSVKVELQQGDTVWSVLQRVLDSRSISYDYSWSQNFGSVYVKSIAGDGEFDHGDGSGWKYNVNGTYPNYGASSYNLSAGESIQWRYTTDLGEDLGSGFKPTPTPKPSATPAPGGSSTGVNPEGTTAPTETPKDTSKAPNQNTNDIKEVYKDADKISSWAYSAIETATVKGFIQGNNGQVNPKDYITRAEFTKILVSALELDLKSDKGITYKDVALGDWFYPYVNAAHKAGLITGFNNEFKPNDKITREQMAAIIVRALSISATKPGTAIKDLGTASAWAKADVETIVATGLMLGDNNQFKPKEFVTREMAAVVATRSHDYKSGNKVAIPNIQNTAVTPYIQNTAAFLQKTVTNPVISTIGGDWTVFGLARSGVKVPDSYYAKYYANVEATLKEKSGKLHSVKYTEYDRVILALTSIGKNIDKVAGYNLLEPLADFDTLIKQGINGPVFALIALDSNHYDIPVVKNVKTQTTREMLIDYILGREISGGGWALGSNATAADPDITGMVIQGLTPYYKTNAKVTAAVDRGIAWLSKTQTADGGFASWESTNSESIAQVIVALTGLGIDPHKDSRFIKNGRSVVDALLGFAAPEGGFYHVKQGGVSDGGAKPGEVDLMATDQAMYALVAYDRFVKGQNHLYNMTDVK
ncbi:S-layer homology domain-containing protein [Paenibacillus sp. FSL R10-2734]|uniref:S-layer homology domain-containing protein n=1 Tax=Paenibacillus sp. FSL R10-2734 TaxID=2954691 RepID=UPI0030D886E0